jgi:hypothetical protein
VILAILIALTLQDLPNAASFEAAFAAARGKPRLVVFLSPT